MLELLRAPLGVPGFVLKVQLLGQSLLQVLQQANHIGLSDPDHPKTSTRESPPDLQDPSESKAGVHQLHDVQEDLQGSDVPIEPVPQVDVLHLRGPAVS